MKRLLVTFAAAMLLVIPLKAKMLAIGGSFGMSNLSNDSFSSDRGNQEFSGFLMLRTPLLPLQIKAGVKYDNSSKEDTIIGIAYNTILNNLSYFASADFRYHIIMTPVTPYVGVGADINNLKYTIKTVGSGSSISADTSYAPELGVNGHIGLSVEPVKTFSIFIEGYYGQIFTNDLADFNNKNIADFGGRAGIIIYFF